MKVLYDSQAFDMQTHGGVSRCFAELIDRMPEHIQTQLSVIETNNVYLLEKGYKAEGETFSAFMNGSHSKLKRAWYKASIQAKYGHYNKLDRWPNLNRLETERLLQQGDFDLFHPTFFNSYFLPLIGNRPFVLTVHDMITEIYSQFYPPTESQVRWKKQVIPKAKHIVAVSENTKNDLVRIMGIPEEKITVVYHGADETPYQPTPVRPYDFEYILYIGERHMYKNFLLFCRDCMPILRRHKELKVVCTGKPFNQEEENFLDILGIKDRFIHTFVNTNQELLDLYHYAVTFVYTSEYEGFGIPILEAYKAHCPVMLNHASCFPEIAQDAAVWFHMTRENSDFEEQFETLYHFDSNERNNLIAKQDERLKHFSWNQSAQRLAEVYEKVSA